MPLFACQGLAAVISLNCMYTKPLHFRCVAYPEDNIYTAVCLDLNIVEQRETLEEVIVQLNDAIIAHVMTAAEVGFPKELIQRPAPDHYWKKATELLKHETRKDETNGVSEFTFYKLPIRTADLTMAR